MWGNLNKLGDLASKAVSNVQKVGLRAKEAINQIDADDFFEKELNDTPPVNPLLKPEVKPKNKELKLNKDVKENSAKQNNPNEENLSNSPVNSKPLIIKKQKAQEAPTNLSGQDLKDPSESIVAKSLDLNSLLSQPTQSNMEKNAKSNPELNERQTETAATSTTASGKKAGNREVPSPSDSNELNELKMALKANEEALETYAIDNDKLIKERNELKELADTFQSKNSTLDKNLTEILAKNTSLEEQVNKLNRELVIAKKSTKVSDIHTEVPEGRKEAISDYIGECVQLYKTDISQKLVENLNQDLLNQIALEEEGINDDVRNLLESWVVKGDVLNKATEGVIPEEKIIKPFYDENLLKEEIECHKDENNKLRVKAEDYEERLRQLEAQLKREQEDFAKYKDETELTLKRYTEDFVRVEQNLENLEEEAKEYKAVLKARGEDIERLEKASQEKDSEIRNLEAKLKTEIEAKEDMTQQYEGIVAGMKDFEGTMMELNKENERLSAQHKEMSQQLAEEKKRAKDIEHTLSVEAKNKLLEKLSNLNSLNRDLEVEKVVESKLTVHDGRISAEGFGQALEDGLILALEMANKKFGSELDVEKEKEREKYNSLLGNFERLQGELRDALKREKEAQSAKEELKRQNDEQTEIIDNLNSSVGNYTNKIKELQKTVNELQETKKRYLDEAAVKNGEIEQLKISLNTLQEEREENANYLARLEAETGEIPELQARLERQAIEIGNLNDVLQAKEEEAQQLNGTIVNLQAVIDDNQQIQENLSSQYTNEIKRLRADLEQSARKSQILQEYKEKFEVLEKDTLEREAKIKELTIKLRETEQEKNAVNAEAAALIKKAKNDAMYKENLVDKRVITNFLVKYFDANATFPVKLGILETLSSILAFNDDDRTKLGLPRQTPEPNNASSPTRAKSLEESKTNQPEKSAETKETSEAEKEEAEKEKAEEQATKPQKSFKQMFMSFLLENE